MVPALLPPKYRSRFPQIAISLHGRTHCVRSSCLLCELKIFSYTVYRRLKQRFRVHSGTNSVLLEKPASLVVAEGVLSSVGSKERYRCMAGGADSSRTGFPIVVTCEQVLEPAPARGNEDAFRDDGNRCKANARYQLRSVK